MKAVIERSARTSISSVRLSENEEDILLELIASLENVTLQENSSEYELDDDDDDDNDNDDDDDHESNNRGSEEGNNTSSMKKSQFTRKLIRDNRRAMKNYKEIQYQSAEKIAARLRQQHLPPSKNKKVESSNSSKYSSSVVQNVTQATKIVKPVNSSVRITVTCDRIKGKGATSKLVVIQRSTSIEELLKLFRNKFSVGPKFNALLFDNKSRLLTALELLSIQDDEMIQLAQLTKVQLAELQGVPSAQSLDQQKTVENEKNNEEISPPKTSDENPSQPEENQEISLQPLQDTSTFDAAVTDRVEESEDDVFVSAELQKQFLEERAARLSKAGAKGDFARTLQQKRSELPIFERREEILSLINRHQVVLIAGETGCGKTTQIPQYILEEALATRDDESPARCRVVVTQPRRVAAINVAERVAVECLGHKPLQRHSAERSLCEGLVGYQIRLEDKSSSNTRLLFCTTGILLRRLQDENYLKRVSHILLDEIHERGVETDFLMAILKKKLATYPHLRLVLMSATLQENLFQSYFHGCPIVRVAGRTFPVAVFYEEHAKKFIMQHRGVHINNVQTLNTGKGNQKRSRAIQEINRTSSSKIPFKPGYLDVELVCELVLAIIFSERKDRNSDRGTGILVFLSGIQQIHRVQSTLQKKLQQLFEQKSACHGDGRRLAAEDVQVLLLHSSLSSELQRRVFQRTRAGQVKVVLSTNIAETSITIDDIDFVLDSGLMKEMRYNPLSNISALQEVFVSRSAAQQRAGRAGRVRDGICFRLFPEEYFLREQSVLEHNIAEIHRIPLEEVILQVIYLNLGRPEVFLQECLESPSLQQLRAAIATLIEIKAVVPAALDSQLQLTALGFHLAKLPLDIRLGKMLIFGCLLNCLEPVLTIAACLSSNKTLFSTSNSNNAAERDAIRRKHVLFLQSHAFDELCAKFIENHRNANVTASKSAKKQSDVEDDQSDVEAAGESSEEFDSVSDHIAAAQAFHIWQRILNVSGRDQAFNFTHQYHLSYYALQEIQSMRNHYRGYLRRAGFLPRKNNDNRNEASNDADSDDDDDDCSDDSSVELVANTSDYACARELWGLVRCALCAGLFPNVVRALPVPVRGKQAPSIRLLQSNQQEVYIHPSSLLCRRMRSLVPTYANDAFFLYFVKNQVNDQVQLFDLTRVPHEALLLFAGNEVTLANNKGQANDKNSKRAGLTRRDRMRVQLYAWIEMQISELHLACFRYVQREIEEMLLQKVQDPNQDISNKQTLISSVVKELLKHCN